MNDESRASSMGSTTDEGQLLERLRSGDGAAFEHLVRAYGGRLRAVALRLLQSESDADDAVQETFLSAFRAIQTFEGRSLLSTWLHRMVVNASLMKLRSKKRRRESELEGLLPSFKGKGVFASHEISWSQSPEDAASSAEVRQLVRDCIEKLPDRFRVALVLRDIEGLSNEELAEHFQITPNAAKIRVHRARQALKTLLEPRFTSER